MNIVHLVPQLNRGGTEKFIFDLCIHQQRMGHRVVVIHFSNINLFPAESKEINVINFPETFVEYRLFKKPFKRSDNLLEYLKALQVDVIHSHSYWTDLIYFGLGLKIKVKITHFHLFYKVFNPGFKFSKKYMIDWADGLRINYLYAKNNNHVITGSRSLYEWYRRRLYLTTGNKLHYIPNAINLQKYHRINLQQVPDPLLLLSIGRIVEVKNHFFLIKIAKFLQSRGLNYKLKIIGDGPLKNSLQKKIIEDNLAEEVVILDNIESIEEEIYRNHIYIHTSKSETFGLSILESMASGLPCIVLNTVEGYQFIKNNVNGFIVDSEDPEKFYTLILKLISDPEFLNRISRNAVASALEYDIKNSSEEIVKLYEKILAG